MTLKQRLQERAWRRRTKQQAQKEARPKRDAWVIPVFEQRRLWLIALIVGLPLLLIVLAGIAQRLQDSTWLLVVAVAILLSRSVLPSIARLTIWRCPKCHRMLPFNKRLNPFVQEHERCPYCGVRLR